MTPLRQRMLEDMGIRNLSANTQLSYLQQVSSYAKHFHQSPEGLGPDDIRAYQVHLTTDRKLSAEGSVTGLPKAAGGLAELDCGLKTISSRPASPSNRRRG